jgi:adenylate cyclase
VNFTAISEAVDLHQLMQMLEEYYTVMSQFITENDGTVGDFIGDGILCFWNSPDPVPRHTQKACNTALKIVERYH